MQQVMQFVNESMEKLNAIRDHVGDWDEAYNVYISIRQLEGLKEDDRLVDLAEAFRAARCQDTLRTLREPWQNELDALNDRLLKAAEALEAEAGVKFHYD